MRITVGPEPAKARSRLAPPISSASSSLTIFTTCWPGLRLSRTPAPRHRSRTCAVNALTTLKFTSASRSARRISLIARSTSASFSLPRERTPERVSWRRSDSWSNTGASSLRAGALVGEQRGGELASVERAQVLEPLANSDQLDWELELGGDRERDAALRCPIELREDDPGQVNRLGERARLAQAVLPGGGIDYDQRLVRRALEALRRHPAHLRQLGHQV